MFFPTAKKTHICVFFTRAPIKNRCPEGFYHGGTDLGKKKPEIFFPMSPPISILFPIPGSFFFLSRGGPAGQKGKKDERFPGGKKIGDFFPGVSSDSEGIGGDPTSPSISLKSTETRLFPFRYFFLFRKNRKTSVLFPMEKGPRNGKRLVFDTGKSIDIGKRPSFFRWKKDQEMGGDPIFP